jgi:hypothetical protein
MQFCSYAVMQLCSFAVKKSQSCSPAVAHPDAFSIEPNNLQPVQVRGMVKEKVLPFSG